TSEAEHTPYSAGIHTFVCFPLMGWLRRMRQEREAHQELGKLTHYLHRAGLSLGSLPVGLLSRIDQHAAAVRDILLISNGKMGVVELAGYAQGVQDAAAESGWRL